MNALGRRSSLVLATLVVVLVCATPATAAIRLGVNTAHAYLGPPSEYEFRRMRLGGVDMARYQFGWSRVQPYANSDFRWEHHDDAVENAARAGVELLPIIIGTPAWVAHTGEGWPVGPDGLYRYYLYVKALRERYGTHGDFWDENPDVPYRPIRSYEIWNEPNRRDNSPVGSGSRPELFARLLDMSDKALEAGGGHTRLISGGVSDLWTAGGTSGRTFLTRLYRVKGVHRDVDAVGIHPYGANPGQVIRGIEQVRATIDRFDQRTPLWITEVGWGTAGTSGEVPVKGENTQASYLRRTISAFKRRSRPMNIDVALWYTFKDLRPRSRPLTWDAHSGLFESAGRKKPAWDAFAKVAGGRPYGDL